jgi:uncharacterized protein (DUF305 family)
VVGPGSAAIIAAVDSMESSFTQADVDFMSGMIPHHAQAIVMSRMCESHGARADIRSLCERIILSQADEIRLMRRWLADRGQPVPDSLSTRHTMNMGGMVHEMLMPGMLTDEQMAELDQARGSRFDSLYLAGMIRHHQGALTMVDELFRQPGAGQETTVFRFANDVVADQMSEIDRMTFMLQTITP